MTAVETGVPAQGSVPPAEAGSPVDELAGRLLAATVGALDLVCIALGRETGLYDALRTAGAGSARQVADLTGLDLRYVEEWLAQQAISGLLEVHGTEEATRRYSLAAGVEQVLLDPDSPAYLAPLADLTAVVHRVQPRLVAAMRTGEGIPYADYGPEAVAAQEALNRPVFLTSLVSEWLPALPDVLARLADPARGAKVLDVGCGAGWSSIALAEAFPHLRVVGVDSDDLSLQHALRNAAGRGVDDRVSFVERPGEAGMGDGVFDLATFFECLHDMAHPVEALRAARAALAPGGCVLVVDERAAETFTAPADEVERFLAAVSVVWCLPHSRVEPDSAALGTCLRPATVVRLAADAGFSRTQVLPVEHPFWRFYRLDP